MKHALLAVAQGVARECSLRVFRQLIAGRAEICKVLVPELAQGTIVILDNLATHKNVAAAKAMRDARCWFQFHPPYSHDLNAIAMAFSKLKAHLRQIGARTSTDMFSVLAEIGDLYSPQEYWNYFKAAGYVSS